MPDKFAWLGTISVIVLWSVIFAVMDGEYLVKIFGG